MDNIITWISTWMKQQCDGEWEHDYGGVKISHIDNPGWQVDIDINGTDYENIDIDVVEFNNGDDDWYFYKVKEGHFLGYGDLFKLETLLTAFKTIIEG
ncbi:rhodanese-related sulfurtransferase [Chitinophaga parva]|uniref:Rhodanese-related sulfurtransferase n=1 Tax=Chitinophaga parva TaxID=2169414 RepID=A0A2T7BQ30_9BACT|nr:immunity 53 family protein [Chitinophaga parva]PUZ29773.1 rhodanese-related sulfurtransferase [Chitinophaga parva]